MNKTLKIVMMIVMMIAMMIAIIFTFSSMVFAADSANIVDSINGGINMSDVNSTDLASKAGKVISLIQVASVILAVILIAVFGFKFIMGSANEKADYQKSFIPLIVGLVVVFAATSIAKIIMSIAQ